MALVLSKLYLYLVILSSNAGLPFSMSIFQSPEISTHLCKKFISMVPFLVDISQVECKVDKGTSHFLSIYVIVSKRLLDMMVMTFPRCVKGADQSFPPWQIKNLKAAFSFYYSSLISREEPLDQLVKQLGWVGGNHASKK